MWWNLWRRLAGPCWTAASLAHNASCIPASLVEWEQYLAGAPVRLEDAVLFGSDVPAPPRVLELEPSATSARHLATPEGSSRRWRDHGFAKRHRQGLPRQ